MFIRSSVVVSTYLNIAIAIDNHYRIGSIGLGALIQLDNEPMESSHVASLISANYS